MNRFLNIGAVSAALAHANRGDEFHPPAQLLGETDGNLGAHLRKLEEAKYVEVQRNSLIASRHLVHYTRRAKRCGRTPRWRRFKFNFIVPVELIGNRALMNCRGA
jgi:hypothetical protein